MLELMPKSIIKQPNITASIINVHILFHFFSLLTYKSIDIQASVYLLQFIVIFRAPGDRQVANSPHERVSRPSTAI